MESAIDKHMQCPRTLSRRVADDYTPPFPMVVARAEQDLTQVVMAYLGVQYRGEENRAEALETLRHIVGTFDVEDGPGEWDATQHTDNSGYDNLIVVGYWRHPETYTSWAARPEVEGWWSSDDRLQGNVGVFREIVSPRADQFETLYAFTEGFPGVGAIMDGVSGEIEEHGYWGSARDRMPKSQTDWMSASGQLQTDGEKSGRVVVRAHDNICLIRSGQDWVDAGEAERKLYLEDVEPVLRAGMDFLRDNGEAIGCYSNRYVTYIDLDGNPIEKSYNIGHWRALDMLERWAESHPTHLRIFTKFFEVVESLEKLKLYHEVSTFDAADQYYEYVNCHPSTGMLRDATVPAAMA
ncbi:phenylacetaldoxime dehydratase family protein [Pseudonocardia endophytica]|uniref:Aldoxime dehydratase n=1 Tax=Pseudonocardia endophytica TaxID=401976 RepID=A0A4R1HWQ9_PSEEN|nr:phenylacetaldoxime dehydratase family protein [Pseudonocardia endophytica]TCK26788.1 aldoxime dehydratase [Pseudonocardia endophytica]